MCSIYNKLCFKHLEARSMVTEKFLNNKQKYLLKIKVLKAIRYLKKKNDFFFM